MCVHVFAMCVGICACFIHLWVCVNNCTTKLYILSGNSFSKAYNLSSVHVKVQVLSTKLNVK